MKSTDHGSTRLRIFVSPVRLVITLIILLFATKEIMAQVLGASPSEADSQVILFLFIIIFCPMMAFLLKPFYHQENIIIAEVLVLVFYMTSAMILTTIMTIPMLILLANFLDPFIGKLQASDVAITLGGLYIFFIIPLYLAYSIKEYFESSWLRAIFASFSIGYIGFMGWFSIVILLQK